MAALEERADREAVRMAVRMLDDLYQVRMDDCISSEEIVERAEEERLPPALMRLFNRQTLDEDCYTRADLLARLERMAGAGAGMDEGNQA